MNARASNELPPAPPSVEARGEPCFGAYVGSLPEVSFARLEGAYRLALPLRWAKHKRWFYATLATPEVLAVLSVADLGYAANAFASAVHLHQREVLFDGGYMGLPRPFSAVGNHPGAGAFARFSSPVMTVRLARRRAEDAYELSARSRGSGRRFSCQVKLIPGLAPPLTVIAPVPGDGVVNVTQKWAALEASGVVEIAGRTYALDGALAGLDYTNGLLARRTAWRWAFASGRLPSGALLGLNLSQGFNELSGQVRENALWIGERLVPLRPATFEYDPEKILEPWRVRTEDGAVDLAFQPIHAHREERDYKVVKSRFVQPLGLFSGAVSVGEQRVEVEKLAGVVEDQDVVW